MRVDNGDLLVDDLKLDPLNYKTSTYFRESVGLLPHLQSQWVLREFFNLHDFHLDRINHDFFRLFSPDHVFSRRSVYEIREGKKYFLGAALNAAASSRVKNPRHEMPGISDGKENGYFLKGSLDPALKRGDCASPPVQILNTRDVHVLFGRGVVEALSILFFLNQSYAQLENIFIDMTDHYKITQFDLITVDKPLTEMQYCSFLTDADQNNTTVTKFLVKLAEFMLTDSQTCPIFFKKRELTLFNIVISPDFDELFDFSDCVDLKVCLAARKKQLREILLASDRFSKVIFQLTPAEFQENLTDFFCSLKRYDQNNYMRHRDTAIKNYLQFFCEFFKTKFYFIATELRHEISAVVFNVKNAEIIRIYNVMMLKGALNQFYSMLDEPGFFSDSMVSRLPSFLSLLRAFYTIVLYFEQNDFHKKQITLLMQTMEQVVNSHEFIHSFISGIYRPVIDCVEISDEINLNTMVRYTQDWLGKTDLIGLNTVLINKNMLLLMFDRAVWYVNESRRAPNVSCSIGFLQPVIKLREQVILAKTVDEINEFIYQLIKLSDESFLTLFFRQLILHCNIELKLGLFIQHLVALNHFDEKIVHAKINALLLVSITNNQVREFWNQLLFMYETVAQEAGWCRIDIQSASAVHFSVSQPSFFGSGNVSRVVVSSAENLLSTTTAVVESDSAKMMVDSLKSIAGSTSDSIVAAAASAKAAVSSAGELISAWWKRS